MPYDIQSHNPDALIIQFGMNDCNYWETDRGNPRVSPKAFAANLEEIITRAFTFGAKRIFLHTNHPSARDQKPMHYANITYQENNRRYNQIIRDVAANFDTRVILNDIEKAFDDFTGSERSRLLPLLLPEPDWLHLSEKGHDLYFSTVFPVIRESLLEIIRT
jgi:lysophospholipase L1-like esterase